MGLEGIYLAQHRPILFLNLFFMLSYRYFDLNYDGEKTKIEQIPNYDITVYKI